MRVEKLDWAALGVGLGLDDAGAGHVDARRAIAEIVGAPAWRDAVDHYVDGLPFAELVRHVLWLVHPAAAMDRCEEIYRGDHDLERRRAAAELVRVVADGGRLSLVAELLADADEGIQNWGAGLLDQLVWSDLVEPEDAERYLGLAEAHPNPRVRQKAGEVRSVLNERSG